MDLWVTGFSTVQIVTLTGCFLLGYTGGYLGPRWPCRTPVLLWFFSACVPHFFKAYTLLKDTELRSQRPVTQVDSGNTKQCLRRCTSHLCWSPPPSGHLAIPHTKPHPTAALAAQRPQLGPDGAPESISQALMFPSLETKV